MIFSICYFLVVVLICYVFKNKESLIFSMILIFVFSAIRYDFGNDYMGYLEGFEEINKYPFSIDSMLKHHYESGWYLLCVYFNDFFLMVVFLSLFNCVTIYFFIKKSVSADYYWLSLFVYLFYPSNFILLLSAMRQSVAMDFILLAYLALKYNKYLLFVLLTIIAGAFHTSAYFVLVIGFIIYVCSDFTIKSNFIIISCYVLSFLVVRLWVPYILNLVFKYFPRYHFYSLDSVVVDDGGTGLGLLILFLLFLMFVLPSIKFDLFSRLYIASFFIMSFAVCLPIVSRINYYFDILAIVFVPNYVSYFKQRFVKYCFLLFYGVFVVFSFFRIYLGSVFVQKLSVYKTIIDYL